MCAPAQPEIPCPHTSAFSHVVSQTRSSFVVLMDATGAYHRQMVREFEDKATGLHRAPLMRLQDATYTRLILVTLQECHPVSQATALQDDLRRAHIEPLAGVVKKSLLATGTADPLLHARLGSELQQMERVAAHTRHAVLVVPWTEEPSIGPSALEQLLG